MKKFISIFLTLCMVLACMFTVVACNKDNNNKDSGSAGSNVTDPSDTGSQTGDLSTPGSASENTWNSIKSTDRDPYTWTPATDLVLGQNDGTQATTVFLVGDSTVCEYGGGKDSHAVTLASGAHPKWGYGMWFGDYLSDKVTVKNLALSGRSSKSFLTEANYQTFKTTIKAGDYVIIGFGHNDAKKEEARYTNPSSQVIHEDSFKYSLYENYIKVAIEKGATPILCTPITRRSPKGDYTGERIHIISGTGDNGYEGGDYVKAIVELGQEKGITVIDLLTLTKEMMIKAGNEGSAIYYATNDNTHLNAYGAKVIAYNFMLEIQKTENSFKNYVDAEKMKVTPTEDILAPKTEPETPTSASAA